ncbi:TRAP transporter large permease [Azospirillum sp. RWY-5-1]|uniref:TRAP transporter large permease protein n=1 Tax=Azospirillum oleiclasticum TaxID=2735135 RepID=A0ABX2TCW1_9PROT|nr:TRAP transporter large permease [Azospirillum oleiclasticum]NYZ15838.1 TRAP transporter large permease [Azospirillum oleiclasticum]NYZ22108.1 TRAP transporter large permease [Azospirillum oleiclasticum]
MITAVLSFAAVFILLGIGVPLAAALGGVGFVGLTLIIGLGAAGSMVAQTAFDTANSYTLSVLPLFLFMANLIARAGIASALYDASNALLGRVRGGLAMATIMGCAGFGTVCGSSLATAATMGSVALPEMKRYGYDDGLATASIAAGGTLGILIPPSIILVIYGMMTEQSIGDLFLAGILPGLLGAVLYIVAIAVTVRLRPALAPRTDPAGLPSRRAALLGVWPVAVLFTVVIGGLYLGVFSATEAAGIGAAGALLIGVARRSLSPAAIFAAALDAAVMTATLLFVLIGALLFSNVVVFSGFSAQLAQFIQSLDVAPILVIVAIVMIYLVLGCIFDSLAMMLLTVPLFAPIVAGFGYDLVWFGIVVVVSIEFGMISPPIGMNLFIIRSLNPTVALGTIYRGIVPFLVADVVRLMLLILVPAIALIVPLTMRVG